MNEVITKEQIVEGLSSMFPTIHFVFIDNNDGSFVLSANGVIIKSVVWNKIISEELIDYFGRDSLTHIFNILEANIRRRFDFDGINWVEAKPIKSRELGFYGYSFMDVGQIFCPYIPLTNDSGSK